MRSSLAVLIVLAGFCAACNRTPESGSLPAAQADAPPAERSDAKPAAAAPAPAAPSALSGLVTESMDSGGYTYLHLETAQGPAWVAVRQAKVATGATVSVENAMLMEGFESPTLKRKFDRVWFGSLAGEGAGPHAATPQGNPHAAGPAAKVEVVKAERAAGDAGRTVAEVHAQRTQLANRDVAVRGTVVKFLPGIMGRNWVHLRDGSGSEAAKDDDLTVTTQDTVEVGSQVVARGRVSADKDFGSGYAYRVIVEEAHLTPEPR
jgi:hypothetical protein